MVQRMFLEQKATNRNSACSAFSSCYSGFRLRVGYVSKTLHKLYSSMESHCNEMHSAVGQNCLHRFFEVMLFLEVR